MALLRILRDPDPTLRKISRPVDAITPRIRVLVEDMKDTLRKAEGVGLAAPQVGVLRRVVIVDMGKGKLQEFINPEIVYTEGKQEEVEGCLSCPGKAGIVERPAKVTVRALNVAGEAFEATGTELIARCFCHELDHLDGTLYIDKATKMLYPDEDGYYEEDED